MKPERIVFIHPFLLHYHLPRLQAFAEECRSAGIAFWNIELASYIDTYRSFVKDVERRFDNTVLFPGKSFARVPAGAMWTALEAKLEELQPDVIFTYGYSLAIMRRARAWAQGKGTAAVLISDSNRVDRQRYRLFELLKSRFVSRYDAAFVGGASSSLYLQTLGLPGDRIVPGYDVIDVEAFCSRCDDARGIRAHVLSRWALPGAYFLFVGRLVQEKNLGRLVDAYAAYDSSIGDDTEPWSLAICGSGPEEDRLRCRVDVLPRQIRKKILLFGLVRQPEIVDFYACASCLVLPSTSESWGLVVNEAMACGLPVLASRRAGCAADLVQNGETGWLFEPDRTAELTRLMLHIHRLDEPTRLAVGLRGQRLISEWGLARFCRGALQSSQIAIEHRRASGRQPTRLSVNHPGDAA